MKLGNGERKSECEQEVEEEKDHDQHLGLSL